MRQLCLGARMRRVSFRFVPLLDNSFLFMMNPTLTKIDEFLITNCPFSSLVRLSV